MTQRLSSETRLLQAIAPLYTDIHAIEFHSEEQRRIEADRLHRELSGRPEADRFLKTFSRHASVQKSALRNVLLTLAYEADKRLTASVRTTTQVGENA